MFNEVQVNSIHYEPPLYCVYNFILQPKYILKVYFSPQILNIPPVQAVRHSLSHSKQLTNYLCNNQLNVTHGKEYDTFPRPSPKHNCVHIQFCTFHILSVCQMMRLNLYPTDGPNRYRKH